MFKVTWLESREPSLTLFSSLHLPPCAQPDPEQPLWEGLWGVGPHAVPCSSMLWSDLSAIQKAFLMSHKEDA